MLNIHTPNYAFICGSHGSGKSYTLNCLLESCLLADVCTGKLRQPLAGLVFHYDINSSGTPAETASLCSLSQSCMIAWAGESRRCCSSACSVSKARLHFSQSCVTAWAGESRRCCSSPCSTLKVRSHCSQMTVMALLNAESLLSQVALLWWMDQVLLHAYPESERVARHALIASLSCSWVGTLQCVAWIGHTHFRNRVACQ